MRASEAKRHGVGPDRQRRRGPILAEGAVARESGHLQHVRPKAENTGKGEDSESGEIAALNGEFRDRPRGQRRVWESDQHPSGRPPGADGHPAVLKLRVRVALAEAKRFPSDWDFASGLGSPGNAEPKPGQDTFSGKRGGAFGHELEHAVLNAEGRSSPALAECADETCAHGRQQVRVEPYSGFPARHPKAFQRTRENRDFHLFARRALNLADGHAHRLTERAELESARETRTVASGVESSYPAPVGRRRSKSREHVTVVDGHGVDAHAEPERGVGAVVDPARRGLIRLPRDLRGARGDALNPRIRHEQRRRNVTEEDRCSPRQGARRTLVPDKIEETDVHTLARCSLLRNVEDEPDQDTGVCRDGGTGAADHKCVTRKPAFELPALGQSPALGERDENEFSWKKQAEPEMGRRKIGDLLNHDRQQKRVANPRCGVRQPGHGLRARRGGEGPVIRSRRSVSQGIPRTGAKVVGGRRTELIQY